MRLIDADKIEYSWLPLTVMPDQFVTKKKIDEMPTADVEPVVHACWRKECKSQITFPDGEAVTLVERQCSNCLLWSNKEIVNYMPKEPAKWCPACGAKMDKKVKEHE